MRGVVVRALRVYSSNKSGNEEKMPVGSRGRSAGGQQRPHGRPDRPLGWPYYKYFMLIDIRAHGSVSCTLSYDSTQCSTYRLRSFVERPRTSETSRISPSFPRFFFRLSLSATLLPLPSRWLIGRARTRYRKSICTNLKSSSWKETDIYILVNDSSFFRIKTFLGSPASNASLVAFEREFSLSQRRE